MTTLQQRALARLPLSEATVADLYSGNHSGTAEQCLKALCESHERLRAELEGANLLLKEADLEIARLRSRLAAALALTDTGSPEFLAAFPRESAPGWWVVERIREVLLG